MFAQWDDHEVTNDWSPTGTADETGYAEDGTLAAGRARPPRLPRIHADPRQRPRRRAGSIARSPMARCSTSS